MINASNEGISSLKKKSTTLVYLLSNCCQTHVLKLYYVKYVANMNTLVIASGIS